MVTDRRDWTTVSFEVGRDALREWREEHCRRSEEVVELWEHVLSRAPGSLNQELCSVYEQVCIAALDCGRPELALECIRELDCRFPRSSRVLRLQAMRYEAIGRYDTANQIYEQLIENDPTNTAYRKRRVAMLIGQGKRLDAIKALNEYLELFINDSEAWMQQSELYLAEADYTRAAHCVEELLLHSPMNSIYLRRVGDVRYSMGNVENVELAMSYYKEALRYHPDDLRALFGIVLCCNQLLGGKASPERKRELGSAGAAAIDRILERYETVESEAAAPNETIGIANAVKAMRAAFMKSDK